MRFVQIAAALGFSINCWAQVPPPPFPSQSGFGSIQTPGQTVAPPPGLPFTGGVSTAPMNNTGTSGMAGTLPQSNSLSSPSGFGPDETITTNSSNMSSGPCAPDPVTGLTSATCSSSSTFSNAGPTGLSNPGQAGQLGNATDIGTQNSIVTDGTTLGNPGGTNIGGTNLAPETGTSIDNSVPNSQNLGGSGPSSFLPPQPGTAPGGGNY